MGESVLAASVPLINQFNVITDRCREDFRCDDKMTFESRHTPLTDINVSIMYYELYNNEYNIIIICIILRTSAMFEFPKWDKNYFILL